MEISVLHSLSLMSSANLLFTVYETESAIEIRSGCYENPCVRVICTCHSYEVAQNFALLAAKMNKLPIADHVQTAERSGKAQGHSESDDGLKYP